MAELNWARDARHAGHKPNPNVDKSGHTDGKRRNPPVDGNLFEPGQSFRRELYQHVHTPGGQRQAEKRRRTPREPRSRRAV